MHKFNQIRVVIIVKKFEINDNQRNVIGKNIKHMRMKKKITQEELVARLNIIGILIDQPMLSKVENLSREVVDYEVIGIAEALGISVESLFENCYDIKYLIRKKTSQD